MASSWPGSSWTARCWPTSPCATPRPSADLPRAPARRRRPDRRRQTHLTGAPPDRSGAHFFALITSPHNEHLKEIRKLAGRKWRDKLRQFVAEGEDLVEAAALAGWAPEAVYVADGSGLDGVPVAPHVLAGISQLGSGTRALGIF